MKKYPTPEPPTPRPPVEMKVDRLFFWLIVIVVMITIMTVSLVLWSAFITLLSNG